MKRRAWRVTAGAAALVAVLVAVLVVANWGTVRDHVEAWHFQLTRETQEIEPVAKGVTGYHYPVKELLLRFAANELRSSVVFDPLDVPPIAWVLHKALPDSGHEKDPALRDPEDTPLQMAKQDIRVFLGKEGYRVLEQRFPRRAYVVIRAAEVIADTPITETFVIPLMSRWR